MDWFARADCAVQKFTAAPSEGFKVWFGRSLSLLSMGAITVVWILGYELLAVYLIALLVVAVCIFRYIRPILTGIGWVLWRAWRWMLGNCFENSENLRDLRGIQDYIDHCLKSVNAYEDYRTGKSAEEIAFELILLMHFTHEEMTGLAWAAVAKLVQVRLENTGVVPCDETTG